MKKESQQPIPFSRRPSTGSLSDSELSSSSLETPISYVTDPEADSKQEPPRTTRQKKDRRPPSTFYLKKKSEMTAAEFLCDFASVSAELHELKDETIDRGRPPIHPVWRDNAFIISRGLAPLAIQQVSYWLFPTWKWHVAVAYPFYWFAFVGFVLMHVSRMDYYMKLYGTLDEKQIGRDRTADRSVNRLALAITSVMFVRTAIPFVLRYDAQTQSLFAFNWNYPLKLAAWEITLDYFFYCYHRLTHEVDSLWSIHRHHHSTKHPTPTLSILAETRQEFLEILLIPLATSLIIPMTFSELYLTMCYTLFVELLGHSGCRAMWQTPVLGWILKPLGMELIIEDHDLHHRFGKRGANFGKQTRVWDRIFGTCAERIECYGM